MEQKKINRCIASFEPLASSPPELNNAAIGKSVKSRQGARAL